METFILNFIENIVNRNVYLVYLVFYISSVLQMIFPPHPGDVILVFQGYLTTVSRSFSFIAVLGIALAGTMTGTVLIHRFGFVNGDKVFRFRLVKKYVDDKHLRRARRLFDKYGAFAIFLSKFVPGINAIIVLFSGMFRMKLSSVLLSAFVSAVLHHVLVLLLGRFLGYNAERVKSIMTAYNSTVMAVIAAILLGIFILRLFGKRKVSPEKL